MLALRATAWRSGYDPLSERAALVSVGLNQISNSAHVAKRNRTRRLYRCRLCRLIKNQNKTRVASVGLNQISNFLPVQRPPFFARDGE